MKLRVLSLFAGIGGFDLGLERTGGFETVAFCEIDPFCQRVLAKHWPGVPIYDDVRTLTADMLRSDGVVPNAICGGFPCQDLSLAGGRKGLEGERSGLWAEYHRLIRELRPEYAVVENSPGLLSLGMGRVLGDLASSGFDAEWDLLSAKRFGARHLRNRVIIVAYPNEERCEAGVHVSGTGGATNDREQERPIAYGVPAPLQLADANARQRSLGRTVGRVGRLFKPVPRHAPWEITSKPVLGRGADGIPHRLDRAGSPGNAVVPKLAEWVGNCILEAEARRERLAA